MNVDAVVESLGVQNTWQRKSLAERIRLAHPDWVSIQFVPYAYANHGLVGARTLPWSSLRGRLGTHIMFHELWIGAHHGASFRERVTGRLQRMGIQNLYHVLSPDVVHCSNRLYSDMLSRVGIYNKILPLVGNIPVQSSVGDPYEEVVSGFTPGLRRSSWTVVALFGAIHRSDNLLSTLRWLQHLCNRNSKQLLVVSLGNCPTAAQIFAELMPQLPAAGRPTFLVKGHLEAAALSAWMRFADCALATTPMNIIEKSGSAIAFAEHGVPVIVTDRGSRVRGHPVTNDVHSTRFWLFGDRHLEDFCHLPPRRVPESRLQEVANQLLTDLKLSLV